ncbi:MAG: hypothetical protein R2838_19040 [Caldilineaceae bacterium]
MHWRAATRSRATSASSCNLTPDATGIAGLNDPGSEGSIRFGKRAGGGALFIMPHFSAMADQGAANLVAYLRSLEPVAAEIPTLQLGFEAEFAMPATLPPAVAPTEGPDRSQYLASLVRCGMCHTPASEDSSPDMDALPGRRARHGGAQLDAR